MKMPSPHWTDYEVATVPAEILNLSPLKTAVEMLRLASVSVLFACKTPTNQNLTATLLRFIKEIEDELEEWDDFDLGVDRGAEAFSKLAEVWSLELSLICEEIEISKIDDDLGTLVELFVDGLRGMIPSTPDISGRSNVRFYELAFRHVCDGSMRLVSSNSMATMIRDHTHRETLESVSIS